MQDYYATVSTLQDSDNNGVLSLADCINIDGELEPEKFANLLEMEEAEAIAENVLFSDLRKRESEEEEGAEPPPKKKQRSRSAKSLRPYYFNETGQMVFLKPTQTFWYLSYVSKPPTEDERWQAKFRRRFRLPHSEFIEMLDRLAGNEKFKRWYRKDAVGNPSSPIELLLLGAFRYLGRGLTFDDLEEYTAINEETHRQFFHTFIAYGATTLYDEFVKYPKNAQEFREHQDEFNDGGLHGAGFSTDATNVMMWNCSHNLKQAHTGWKQSHPARTYNLTCNHRRQILHTTRGHPSRWNDKTLAWLDEFLIDLRDGRILQDVYFKLFSWRNRSRCGIGESTKTTRYRGAWGLCDNGYHRWSCTQAPGKNDVLLTEKHLSQWIESFRKDVECVFGILKGRFRILKTGIRLAGDVAADNVWLTCCALHNLLLEVDGLHTRWEHGIRSDWEGELGDNESEEVQRYGPLAIQRLNNPETFGSRNHEQECALPRTFIENRPIDDDAMSNGSEGIGLRADETGALFINSLSYSEFRSKLVEHFDILWRRDRIVWPRSKKNTLGY